MAKRKQKISQFAAAQKALQTSSASRRFRAEGDPEEEDIKREIKGSAEDFEEWQEREQAERQASQADEEKQIQRLLLANVPESYRAEAIRRLREEKRRDYLRREERGESAYEAEDLQAKRTRHILSGLVNQAPLARYLARGGATYQSLEGETRTPSIEEQMTSVRTPETGTEPEELTREQTRELFGHEKTMWQSPQDKARAEELFTRHKKLKVLETKLKTREQHLPEPPETLPQGEIPGQTPLFRQRATQPRKSVSPPSLQAKKPPSTQEKLFEIPPKLTERVSISKLRQKVVEERQNVEKELSQLRQEAIVEGERRTPEQTEQLVRERLEEAFEIPDPTGRRRTLDQPIPTIKRPASEEQLHAFINYTVQSYHAPSHAQRVDAAQKAQRLASRISQQAQEVISKKEQVAQQNKVRQQILGTTDPTGLHSAEELRKARESREGFQYVPGEGYRERPPRPPGAPPRPGEPGWIRPPGPYDDPRFNAATVEDIYDAYGHEKIAPRYKWEKQKLASRLTGEEITEPKPEAFRSIKQQTKFLKNQTTARWQGFKHGTEILGITGRRTPAAFPGRGARTAISAAPRNVAGVTPNIAYEYKLRNPKENTDEALSRQAHLETLMTLPKTRENLEKVARQRQRVNEFRGPITKTLLPTDLRTRFNVGSRDIYGQLRPGEYDEIVAPVKTQPQQTEAIRFRSGKREPKAGKERLPEGIDEIRYIASPGNQGQTRTIGDPENQKTITQVRDTSGRWFDVPRSEYNQTEDMYRREVQVPRQIQYRYVDPKKLELAGMSERDIATFRVPKIRSLNERLLHLQFTDSDESRLNQILGKPLRVHAEAQKLEAARKITTPPSNINPDLLQRYHSRLQERHGIRDKSEAKVLAEAAVAAGYYANREKLTKGYAPAFGNRFIKGIRKTSPSTDVFLDKHLGDLRFAVDQAYVRPSIEKAAQLPFMFSHPFSSPTGQALGLNFDRFKYRQERIGTQKLADRIMEQQANRVERVARTHEFIEKHKTKRGPVGSFTRWRMAALKRSPDYQFGNQEGVLAKAIKTAQEAQNEGTIHYWRNLTGTEEVLNLTPEIQKHATSRLRKYAEVRNQTKPSFSTSQLVKHKAGFVDRALEHPGLERNILVGGAAVGTAAGAAYLYHRHKENKKPDDEKVAFYNKALPPPFYGPPLPKARVTERVTFGNKGMLNELRLAGKELPTQIGVRFQRKRYALRPMDRPAIHGSVYDQNLPVVGGISFRGTPGGSRTRGLIYYGTDTPKRTAIRRSTHDVHIGKRKLPGATRIDSLKNISLQTRNPRLMTSSQMDDLIWAHAGTPLEDHVKGFYRGMGGRRAEQLLEKWEDEDELQRIRRQKGERTPAARAFQRAAIRERRRVYQAPGIR